jgi:hypothetical protein
MDDCEEQRRQQTMFSKAVAEGVYQALHRVGLAGLDERLGARLTEEANARDALCLLRARRERPRGRRAE